MEGGIKQPLVFGHYVSIVLIIKDFEGVDCQASFCLCLGSIIATMSVSISEGP